MICNKKFANILNVLDLLFEKWVIHKRNLAEGKWNAAKLFWEIIFSITTMYEHNNKFKHRRECNKYSTCQSASTFRVINFTCFFLFLHFFQTFTVQLLQLPIYIFTVKLQKLEKNEPFICVITSMLFAIRPHFKSSMRFYVCVQALCDFLFHCLNGTDYIAWRIASKWVAKTAGSVSISHLPLSPCLSLFNQESRCYHFFFRTFCFVKLFYVTVSLFSCVIFCTLEQKSRKKTSKLLLFQRSLTNSFHLYRLYGQVIETFDLSSTMARRWKSISHHLSSRKTTKSYALQSKRTMWKWKKSNYLFNKSKCYAIQ